MWILLSLAAAIVWGIDYLFAEKVMGKISPLNFMTLQMIIAIIILLPIALFSNLKSDISLIASDKKTSLFFGISTMAFIFGSLLIVSSIKASNAAWAGLIEISYPLFIILFGWLIFKEHNLSPSIILGGALIFSGVFIISYFGK